MYGFSFFPTLLMAGVLIFFIMSMSAQSGGSSNSKMMNFGKRANARR